MRRLNMLMAPEDNNAGGDWAAGLPDDLKAVVATKGFKAPADVVKSYHELEAHLGNSIRIPGPEAGDADKKAFREKLQKAAPELIEVPADKRPPGKAEEYDLSSVTFDAGAEPTAEDQAKFRSWALERGLSKSAAAAEWKRVADQKAESVKALRANEAALKREFGAAYDDEMKGLRIWAEKTNAPEDLKQAIAKGHLPVATVNYLRGLAKSLGTETRELGLQGGDQTTPKLTAREANARIEEINRQIFAKDSKLSTFEIEELTQKALKYAEIVAAAEGTLVGAQSVG